MKYLRWTALLILFIIKWAMVFVFSITIIQHFITPVYNFKEGKKFEGEVLYNPYSNSKYNWLRMNLHAHSKAWGGLTAGMQQNNQEIFDAYTKMGYDIIGISNYHDPQQIYFKGIKDSLTVYEYGYNLFKAHRLIVGYDEAKFREVTFFHSIHDRQYILNKAYPDSKLTIIAHPQFGKGHEMSDFSKMSNYHLIEVLNHYRYSEGEWDLALSSGKPVFIIGNDDMHYLDKPGEVGVRYTMVDDGETLINTCEELKTGNAYGVSSPDHFCNISLDSCKTEGMSVKVQFDEAADKILFITDHGVIKDSVANAREATYTFKPDDSYVRVIAIKETCKLYLNPVFRTFDGNLPKNEAEFKINWFYTIGEKLILVILALLLSLIILRTPIKF